MRFRAGSYKLLVSPVCFPRFGIVLEDLRTLGTPAVDFLKSLRNLAADISRGADLSELDPIDHFPDEFAVTLHGYRVRFRIDQALKLILMLDIDES
jgi:hypothetical protein